MAVKGGRRVPGCCLWLLYGVWRSPHRSDLATYGAFAAAVVDAGGGLDRLGLAGEDQSGLARRAAGQDLDRVADLLAVAVQDAVGASGGRAGAGGRADPGHLG